MRWDYGHVYKEIRQAKGLTQKEVCGDFLSRSHLANIEQNRVMPSYEIMEHLLRQIDMSFGEFKFICNYYQPNLRSQISQKVNNILSLPKVEDLKEIQQLCQTYLKEVGQDIPIQNILKQMKVLREIQEYGIKTDSAQELATILWQDLQKRNTWYMSDLRILSTIIYYFPFEQIDMMTIRILQNFEKYEDYLDLDQIQFSIISNLATLYLYHDDKNQCFKLSQRTLELARRQKRYDQLGFAQVRMGICQNNPEQIEKGLNLLTLTEETALLEQMKKEVEYYYKNIEKENDDKNNRL